jgi:AraC-like DNA-binding protein
MSRSAFADRFKERVGKSPLEYLADWRMHLAMRFLQDNSQKLSIIAANLGYESDTTFSKAFKKRTGTTPSEYRARKREDSIFPRRDTQTEVPLRRPQDQVSRKFPGYPPRP